MPLIQILAVSDEVWLSAIAAIVTVVTMANTLVLSIMAQRTKNAVVQTAANAAVAVREVKTTLQDNTTKVDDKLDGLTRLAEATHVLVNSAMGAQLKLNAETSRFKADTTGDPIDIAAAELAEHTWADHVLKQKAVDANSELHFAATKSPTE
jgi:hypothetical protein